ncbi:MAG TPA: lysylphosphatidylglycerol synthase transmembrane domain-containing protein, partial [Alphaproteobacteria bacterium]
AWRWGLLCDDPRVTYPRALTVTLAALLSNLLLITSVSGVLVRIALSVQHGMAWVKATCAATIDRLMTLAALILLAALLMPALGGMVEPRLFRAAALSLAVFIGIGATGGVLFFGRRLREFLSRNAHMREIIDYVRGLFANPARTAVIIISSLAAQIAYFLAVFVIARATGAEIGFMQLMTVLPVIALVASLPLSFGGWGIREGAFVYGLGLLGVPMETAFLISVQIGLLSMLSVAVTALPVLALSGDGRGFIFNPHRALQETGRGQ